jgi:GNAT superfamily N-acetyltransferase
MVARLDGEIVGYLGIVPVQYSYSLDRFLTDTGFFVLPAHRGGAVARALLQEARGIADRAGLALKIVDTNVVKRRRPGRAAITAEIIGYRPAGRVFTHHSKVN